MFVDLVPKIVEKTCHGHGCPRSKRAIRFPRMLAHALEDRDKFFLPIPFFNPPDQIPNERQCLSTGSAPAAGLPDEEFKEIEGGAHEASLLVKNNNCARAQPISR